LLLACKQDELDENIPQIKDLTRAFSRVLPSSAYIPTFAEIVECERDIVQSFKWDLMMLIPSHFVKALLANGVVLETEADRNSSL
jgi:hypothetical protein